MCTFSTNTPNALPLQETRQAAAYGLGLLEANEKLQVELTALQIQFESEVDELTVERDAFKRHHDHALLEIENWKRKYTRLEEAKDELSQEFGHFAAQCTCRNGAQSDETVRDLTEKLAELELSLLNMQANEQANAATITNLKNWKKEAEYQRKESQEITIVEAQRDLSYVKKLEDENAKLHKTTEQLSAEKKQLVLEASASANERRLVQKEMQVLLDEVAEIRLECSSKTELLLTVEAKCSRLQRELSLLEHVSYLSLAVIDHDTEEDDEDDEDVVDHKQRRHRASVAQQEGGSVKTDHVFQDTSLGERDSTDRRESMAASDLMPSPYTAFPTTVKAADGASVAVSPSDLESHKKLHHYFHLTAQSIIHENNLHEKCFRSSSRFTIDSWYREIIALDIPYLEWHAWLISRIGQVAASVQDDEDYEPLLSVTTPESGPRKHQNRHFGGFFLRKDPENSPVSASHRGAPFASPATAGTATASPSNRPRLVPFSVARAFFRLLRKRDDPEQDSSSEEQEGASL